ncbi:MAG: flap structure-specific endonuclease, partial [Candidatus Thermoplasmatota archaeon]
LKPTVTDDYKLSFNAVDEASVKRILVDEHDFGEDRVRATFPRYAKLQEALKQRSLDMFF